MRVFFCIIVESFETQGLKISFTSEFLTLSTEFSTFLKAVVLIFQLS